MTNTQSTQALELELTHMQVTAEDITVADLKRNLAARWLRTFDECRTAEERNRLAKIETGPLVSAALGELATRLAPEQATDSLLWWTRLVATIDTRARSCIDTDELHDIAYDTLRFVEANLCSWETMVMLVRAGQHDHPMMAALTDRNRHALTALAND